MPCSEWVHRVGQSNCRSDCCQHWGPVAWKARSLMHVLIFLTWRSVRNSSSPSTEPLWTPQERAHSWRDPIKEHRLSAIIAESEWSHLSTVERILYVLDKCWIRTPLSILSKEVERWSRPRRACSPTLITLVSSVFTFRRVVLVECHLLQADWWTGRRPADQRHSVSWTLSTHTRSFDRNDRFEVSLRWKFLGDVSLFGRGVTYAFL